MRLLLATSGSCTTAADCCTGNCTDGMCGDREVECTPIGGACTDSADCCDGYYSNTGNCFFSIE